MQKTFKPPAGITPAAKGLWTRIADQIELDEPAVAILGLLVEAFDEMKAAQAHVKKHGQVLAEVTGAGHKKFRQNPSMLVIRDCRASIMRAYHCLGLDVAPTEALK